MIDMLRYVKIDSDDWEDVGKIYKVVSYFRRSNSTAAELELELENGKTIRRVVAYHMLEWIDEDS
jgi:hypothetical protein